MTPEQLKELREARIESQRLGDAIYALETEIKEMDMEMRFLELWKRGRWVGFTLSLTVFLILGTMYTMYFWMFTKTREFDGYANAVVFSVSSVMTGIMTAFVFAMAIITLVLGRKLYMEMGRSKAARDLAKRKKAKNYYSRVEYCVTHKIELQKSIVELKEEQRDFDRRIDQLMELEKPWDQNWTD